MAKGVGGGSGLWLGVVAPWPQVPAVAHKAEGAILASILLLLRVNGWHRAMLCGVGVRIMAGLF